MYSSDEGVDERTTFIVDPVDENILDGFSSQRRGFIQVADDFSAQRPQVIDVFLNGLRRQVRSQSLVFEEWAEAGHQLLARGSRLSLPSTRAARSGHRQLAR